MSEAWILLENLTSYVLSLAFVILLHDCSMVFLAY